MCACMYVCNCRHSLAAGFQLNKKYRCFDKTVSSYKVRVKASSFIYIIHPTILLHTYTYIQMYVASSFVPLAISRVSRVNIFNTLMQDSAQTSLFGTSSKYMNLTWIADFSSYANNGRLRFTIPLLAIFGRCSLAERSTRQSNNRLASWIWWKRARGFLNQML